jgi:hypothetical protein
MTNEKRPGQACLNSAEAVLEELQTKKKRGRPSKDKRGTFTFRVSAKLREKLEAAAASNRRSVSEEIEYYLGRYLDIEEAHRQAVAWANTSRASAIRAAGLQILREVDGRPTRVIVDLETLLAEADGIARGLRDGFIDDNAPAVSRPHAMTQEEWDQGTAKLAEIKREIDEAQARTLAADQAADETRQEAEAVAESRFALLYRAVELKLELEEDPTEAELHELNQYCEAIGRLHKLAEARRSKTAAG